MTNINKKFKDVQNYAVKPRSGLYAKIWERIQKLLASGNKNKIPNNASPTSTNAAEPVNEEMLLAGLQSYVDKENPIPAFNFKKIVEAASGINGAEAPVAPKKSKVVYWSYRVAAAAVVTGIVSLIYINTIKSSYKTNVPDNNNTVQHKNPTQVTDTINNKQPVTGPVTELVKEKPQHSTIEKSKKAINTAPLRSNENDEPRITGSNNITKSVKADIFENDFFFTLTSFNPTQADGFLSDVKKDAKISINNYSYVNVSDKMASFLKQMYDVNRKKKPTWKARRAKEKLDKWKKKDEKQFDVKFVKNPLDILDLSEFIFSN